MVSGTRIELQRAWHPDLFTPGAAGPLAHPADIMESVERAFPDERLSGVDAPTTTRPTAAYVEDDRPADEGRSATSKRWFSTRP